MEYRKRYLENWPENNAIWIKSITKHLREKQKCVYEDKELFKEHAIQYFKESKGESIKSIDMSIL